MASIPAGVVVVVDDDIATPNNRRPGDADSLSGGVCIETCSCCIGHCKGYARRVSDELVESSALLSGRQCTEASNVNCAMLCSASQSIAVCLSRSAPLPSAVSTQSSCSTSSLLRSHHSRSRPSQRHETMSEFAAIERATQLCSDIHA